MNLKELEEAAEDLPCVLDHKVLERLWNQSIDDSLYEEESIHIDLNVAYLDAIALQAAKKFREDPQRASRNIEKINNLVSFLKRTASYYPLMEFQAKQIRKLNRENLVKDQRIRELEKQLDF